MIAHCDDCHHPIHDDKYCMCGCGYQTYDSTVRCTKHERVEYGGVYEWSCHKPQGHDGVCSTHWDCGVQYSTSEHNKVTCGKPPSINGGPCDEHCKTEQSVEQPKVKSNYSADAESSRKANYIGAPACFKLETCCQQLVDAFGRDFGIYQVGSSLYRPDWRDVDLRYILADDKFDELFPQAGQHWEFDPRWLIMTNLISDWLSVQSGLPVDFQFQPQSFANERYPNDKGEHNRNAMGIRITGYKKD